MNKPRQKRQPAKPIIDDSHRDNERALLGSMIILSDTDRGRSELHGALAVVSADDFSDTAYGQMFCLLVEMLETGEPMRETIVDRTKRAGIYDSLGGGSEIGKIIVAGSGSPRYFAERVRSEANRRRMLVEMEAAIAEIQQPCVDHHATAADLAAKLESLAARRAVKFRSVAEIAVDIRNQLDRPPRPLVSTGLSKFDKYCGGFAPGELIILAARTSIGKSAMACQIAEHCAANFGAVLFITLEMEADDIVRRIISRESVVGVKQIRSGNLTPSQRQDVVSATENCNETRLCPHYIPTAKIRDITTAAKAFKAERGISLLVVDYLQIIEKSDYRLSQREAVGQSTMTLKRLAGELDCPVLCLSQFNRETTKQELPTLANLSESGSIEADSDMVLAIHRKGIQDIDGVLMVMKNRNGETADLNGLRWLGGAMQFRFLDNGLD